MSPLTVPTAKQLGVAQITAQISTTSLTNVDATGLTTTVTVGAKPIVIQFFCAWATHTVDLKQVTFTLLEGASAIQAALGNISGAGGGTERNLWAYRNPAAGSYTYKLQWNLNAAGTGTLWADPTFPAFIRVMEV